MSPDFSPLVRAVVRLDEGLTRHRGEPADEQLRDGLIQRFEFTYDLAHKMLRRTLEAGAAAPDEIDRMSFPTLIRAAFAAGLVASDWTAWRVWREMRNITSHTHDEAKARQVAAAIPDFLTEAREVVRRLEASPGGMTLALASNEAATVRDILARHLPAGVEVAVFGSRAGGRVKPASDLDLALLADGPLLLEVLAELSEAFDDSPLPWKVDLVDRACVSPAFDRIIAATAIRLDYR